MPSLRLIAPACAILLMCTACSPAPSASSQQAQPDESSVSVLSPSVSAEPEATAPEVFAPDRSDAPAQPEQPSVSDESNTPAPLPQPEPPSQPPTQKTEKTDEPALPEPPPAVPPQPPVPSSFYDFSQPVPESQAVDNSYFSDAAFVGDSRMEGFYLYSAVKTGKKLTASGLSVFTLNQKTVMRSGGKSYTLPEVLSLTQYGKIYLGFGTNELGYINENAFYEAYCRAVDTVRSLQPNAVIYAQTLAPVNEERVAATGGPGHLNNERLRLYNDLIRKAAKEKHLPLLDVYSALAVDGTLPVDASRDGVHLNSDYCKKQLVYFKTHTVDFDTLYSHPDTETEVPPNETTDIPASDPVADPVADPAADPVADSSADSLLPEHADPSLPTGTDPTASEQ